MRICFLCGTSNDSFMFAFVWLRIIGSRMSSMEVVYSFFDDLEVLVTLSILNTWIRKRNCDEHLIR